VLGDWSQWEAMKSQRVVELAKGDVKNAKKALLSIFKYCSKIRVVPREGEK